MNALPQDIATQETRIALLENNQLHIAKTLDRIERKIDDGLKQIDRNFEQIDRKFDKKFEQVEVRYEKIEFEITRIQDRMWSNFLWIIGTVTIPVCSSVLIYIGKEILTYWRIIT